MPRLLSRRCISPLLYLAIGLFALTLVFTWSSRTQFIIESSTDSDEAQTHRHIAKPVQTGKESVKPKSQYRYDKEKEREVHVVTLDPPVKVKATPTMPPTPSPAENENNEQDNVLPTPEPSPSTTLDYGPSRPPDPLTEEEHLEKIKESTEALYAYARGEPTRPINIVFSTVNFGYNFHLPKTMEHNLWPILQRLHIVGQLPNVNLHVLIYSTYKIEHWFKIGYIHANGTRSPFSYSWTTRYRTMGGGYILPFEKERYFMKYVHEFDLFFYGEGDHCFTEYNLEGYMKELLWIDKYSNNSPRNKPNSWGSLTPGMLRFEVFDKGKGDPIAHADDEPPGEGFKIGNRSFIGVNKWLYSAVMLLTQEQAYIYFNKNPRFPPPRGVERIVGFEYRRHVHPGCLACFLGATECGAFGPNCVHSKEEAWWARVVPLDDLEMHISHHNSDKYAGVPPGFWLKNKELAMKQTCPIRSDRWTWDTIYPEGGYELVGGDVNAPFVWEDYEEPDNDDELNKLREFRKNKNKSKNR